ncbi:uncharacterized protein A4U43_C07F29480 [Asparagus officinalis]|uniref:Protein kinase domain-containing protein n=1 Tax=Asparagus officinalis TaxID=4686 RepID=A0A5P1EL26_ASPOF|nr:uncharacterized protein A4U43_C07F29480 [Asparagus officinalis]
MPLDISTVICLSAQTIVTELMDILDTFIKIHGMRISMSEIRTHSWFLKNLPANLMDDNMMSNQYEEPDQPMQSVDEIMQIIAEATIPAAGTRGIGQFITDSLDMDDDMEDLDSDPDLDVDSSGEIVYAM